MYHIRTLTMVQCEDDKQLYDLCTTHMQLSYLCHDNEYALSKDIDVTLWLAFREHNNQLPLKEAFDEFVIA